MKRLQPLHTRRLGAVASALLAVASSLHGCGSNDSNPIIQKVKLEFWGEAGCPLCHNFTTQVLGPLLSNADMQSILDFDMVPFGNAYYVTDKTLLCGGGENISSYVWATSDTLKWDGYTASVRQCYDLKCGANSTHPEECYQDGPYCQHGKAECIVNAIMACSKRVAGHRWIEYMPFVVCMETAYTNISTAVSNPHDWCQDNVTAIDHAINACAVEADLDAEGILTCYWEEAAEVQAEMARATPVHTGVPWVTIENKSGIPLVSDADNASSLLRALCDAWQYNGGSNMAACASDSALMEALSRADGAAGAVEGDAGAAAQAAASVAVQGVARAEDHDVVV